MLMRRSRVPRVPPTPSTVPPSPESSAVDHPEADARRSLGALMREDEDSSSPEAADRYRAAARALAEEGGARVVPASPSTGPALTVTSNGAGDRPADIELRFSRSRNVAGDLIFELRAPGAKSVQIAGDFTDWRLVPLALSAESPGCWRCTMALPPGEYRYKFRLDGRWINDPLNPLRKPNPFGETDSIVRVSTGP